MKAGLASSSSIRPNRFAKLAKNETDLICG